MSQEADLQRADQLREEGTAKYKAKEYEAAIDLYTRSIALNPNEHRCYSNRSAAYTVSKTNLEQALADAEKCIELLPSWAKGYVRVCEALKAMNRAGEAKACLEKGLEKVSAEDRGNLEKNLKEVPTWELLQALRGTWHGTVNEVLGGYDQQMEFLENDTGVRVDVLGRSIIGKFWLDLSHEPYHLNIQVPHAEVPAGMPPPAPVPYIARIDSVGLHLCCPYLKMERPTEFSGPGYVLMKSGAMKQFDDSTIANLSFKEKVTRCAQELLKAMPTRKLEEPSSTDTEDVAGEKLMASVRFESTMYSVQRTFGENMVKEVIGHVRSSVVPADLEGVEELKHLAEKMKIAGLLDEEEPPKAPVKPDSSSSGPAALGPEAKSSAAAPAKAAPKEPTSKAAPEQQGHQREVEAPGSHSSGPDNGSCAAVVGGVLFSAAALVAVAFMLSKKQRS